MSITSLAQLSDADFLLTLTNTDVPKHKGLTMFLVPMTTPGITVSEVKTLGGVRTNITTYQSVRVPDSARVGDVDGGWRVLALALEFEHAGGFGADIERVLQAALDEAGKPADDGRRLLDDPTV